MSETPRKRAYVVRAFTDAGTGERFERGATRLIDAGAFANYAAAGLVSAPPPPSETAPAEPADAPPSGDAAPDA